MHAYLSQDEGDRATRQMRACLARSSVTGARRQETRDTKETDNEWAGASYI